MIYYRSMKAQGTRETGLPDGYPVWCRIEELGGLCGYDPFTQFGLLCALAEAYPGRAGQDPDDFADEHPMQALACYVRKYLDAYPEAAEALAAACEASGEPRPGIAA